ncbi:glutamyl-tRNA(Gln) amidotransferase subunit PET112 [Sporobolomyces koalae]|uniref:glutamyl-tRNA(Gln) amidotransferase subunit PET112 n=1 Tax=Sporobolomyces koalae TaxID=500713 RepID=UPI0031734F9B
MTLRILCSCRSIVRNGAGTRHASIATARKRSRPADDYPGWQPTIGVELHVQLKGNHKLFSSAYYPQTDDDALPNSHVALLDAAIPGTLPVVQPRPVRLALLACLAFNCDINRNSTFDRKHYFYPDQPVGYQITQKYHPLATGGAIDISTSDDETHRVRLEQVQLEQDTAKSFHDPSISGTLIDLNRAGTALIEIVTRPDLRTAQEAATFVKSIQAILRHVGASSANMDRGELRCDVNVSVRRTSESGDTTPGTRCEIKNLNGIKFITGAINSEISRQIDLLSADKPVIQSTRGYDPVTGSTFHLRSKEDAPDYRYFPDPELGSLAISSEQLERLRNELPELPEAAFERLQSEYKLTPRDARILVALGEGISQEQGEPQIEDQEIGSASIGVTYFERVAQGRDPKIAANWVIHELLGQLTKTGFNLVTNPIEPEQLGHLIDAVSKNRLTGTNAKSLLREYLSSFTGTSSPVPFSTHLSQILSSIPEPPSNDTFTPIVERVIETHPNEVDKIRKGNIKVIMRLVGQVMKESQGKADAKWVRQELENRLLQ